MDPRFRGDDGLWGFPGGFYEADESVETALPLLLAETVGIHVSVGER